MPARIEYRPGSIFDVECDLIVVPIPGGTMPPRLRRELIVAGIAFPPAVSLGDVVFSRATHPRYGIVAYAATGSGPAASRDVVEKVSRTLGDYVAKRGVPTRICAPLLGTGFGDLPADASAAAMTRGFLPHAPDGVVLTISIQNPETFEVLSKLNPRRPPIGATTGPKRHLKGKIGTQGTAPAARPKPLRTRVFISYSRPDADWLKRLQTHLQPLKREGALIWDDTQIKAGAEWRKEIRAALAETRIAILLVSADFLASDFITLNELPPLLKAAADDGATILPVIVSPSRFERMESLSRFQAVNDPKQPLVMMSWGESETVLDNVAKAVEDALDS